MAVAEPVLLTHAKLPDETQDIPCMELFIILIAFAAVELALSMPVTEPELANARLSKPAETVPNWLLNIIIDIAPAEAALLIPVNVVAEPLIKKPCSVLLFKSILPPVEPDCIIALNAELPLASVGIVVAVLERLPAVNK